MSSSVPTTYSIVNPIDLTDTNQSIWTKGWRLAGMHVRPSRIGNRETKGPNVTRSEIVYWQPGRVDAATARSPCGRIGKPLQDKRNRLS